MTGKITSRMPAAEYHSLPGVSITRLKNMKRSALHYRHFLAAPPQSSPMTLGTASHCSVLEPERFGREYAMWSRRSKSGSLCPRTGQFWESFVAESGNKSIITEDEADTALTLAKAVRSSPAAMRYLQAGDPEVTMQWEVNAQHRRGRADWLTIIDDDHYLVGLKTARDCRPFVFGNAAAKLGYHLQWAYYHDGYEAITGRKPKMVEIVVESSAPHAVVVYRITEDIIEQGRDEYVELIEALQKCEASGEWPGPATDEIDLSLPSWVYQQQDDLSELDLDMGGT